MSDKTIRYIESSSRDPYFNLALEEFVFENLPKSEEYFMLWQNANTIVVGKHQNTIEEINVSYVDEHKIDVVRRLSGGGAVYHDLGNINFTFICDANNIEELNLQYFCTPVVETLKKIGIEAEQSGRNDITIDGKKFSGNAQYIKDGRIMHHGTLMFDSNLSVVAAALNVSKDKIVSKGFKSVKSRVTNILPYVKDENFGLDEFKDLLKANMTKTANLVPYKLTESDLQVIEEVKSARYGTWEWNYGKSPSYAIEKSRRIEGVGKLDIKMNIKNGKISDIDVYGDFFGDGLTPELKNRLLHSELIEVNLCKKMENFDISKNFHGLGKEDFIKLLMI